MSEYKPTHFINWFY